MFKAFAFTIGRVANRAGLRVDAIKKVYTLLDALLDATVSISAYLGNANVIFFLKKKVVGIRRDSNHCCLVGCSAVCSVGFNMLPFVASAAAAHLHGLSLWPLEVSWLNTSCVG